MTDNSHSLELGQDDNGWDFAACECGWMSSPCPGAEIAAECYADHLVAVAGSVAPTDEELAAGFPLASARSVTPTGQEGD